MKSLNNSIAADVAEQVAHDVDFARRFGGVARLYGQPALERFRAAHVCVIGVGGVGSWIVEALARSAVGALTLIDLDNVAESNINRQIQALSGTIGQAKIDALAERIAQINPYCKVTLVEQFIEPGNLEQMIGTGRFDYVVDAIDSAKAKAALIAWCRAHQLPLITIGGAGGQTDPTKIAVRDLSKTEQEPLLKRVRKLLRVHYGFPRGEKNRFNVDAVFSMEPLRFPENEANCSLDADQRGVTGINCAGFGSSVVVTASFGMVAAAHLLNQLAGDPGRRFAQGSVQPDAPLL
jgi:tRNA A37 threonylcarbamoyladenosine dehydratase